MQQLSTLILCSLITAGAIDAFEIGYPNWQGWQGRLAFPSWRTSQRTITPAFNTFIEGILEKSDINGLSLSIIRKAGVTEYGAWGNKTEDGNSMKPTVSKYIY